MYTTNPNTWNYGLIKCVDCKSDEILEAGKIKVKVFGVLTEKDHKVCAKAKCAADHILV